MTEITVEEIEAQSEELFLQIAENTLINWENVKGSQQALLKAFDLTN